MGQTVGKPVERNNKKPIIEELTPIDENEFYVNPIEFIRKRFETRASIEEWGFLWAHRILEEVFVRPELDMKWILNTLHKDDLANIVPESEMETISLDPNSLKSDKLKDLHAILTSHLTQREEENNDEEFLNQRMNGMMGLMKKMWNGVCQFCFGASAIDVLVESDRYFELMEELDVKIRRLKRDITNELFQKKLQDIKTKFSAILKIFEKVISGKDDFITRKKRLDSLFYHCEEIIVLINDTESVIFEKAHYCIDFVSNFLVFHLGMLQIAEEDFELRDYKERRTNALKFYPILMKSYIDKAMSNYVSAIIVNYHNQYSTLKEHEEIFNEMTGGVIYKVENSGLHLIWGEASLKEMEKDRMFYGFSEKKLMAMNPSFLCSLETPLLCRALRYGIAMKLEDLFTDYVKNIEMCISLLGRHTKKGDVDPGSFDFNASGDENSSISTICTIRDEDKSVSSSQKYHEQRIKNIEKLSQECFETREKANQELKNLEAVYKQSVTSVIEVEGIKSDKRKLELKSKFIEKLKSTDDLISNMNKYLCFSVENRRFFNVSF